MELLLIACKKRSNQVMNMDMDMQYEDWRRVAAY